MAVPLILFAIGSVSILVIFFIGVFFEKPYIEILAGGFGMLITIDFLNDGQLAVNAAYTGAVFANNTVSIGDYALIPTAFTLICFIHVIVGYQHFKSEGKKSSLRVTR